MAIKRVAVGGGGGGGAESTLRTISAVDGRPAAAPAPSTRTGAGAGAGLQEQELDGGAHNEQVESSILKSSGPRVPEGS